MDFIEILLAQMTPPVNPMSWETFVSALLGSGVANGIMAWLIYQKTTVAEPAAAKACQEERENLLKAYREEAQSDRTMYREEAAAQRLSHEKELQSILSLVRTGTVPAPGQQILTP